MKHRSRITIKAALLGVMLYVPATLLVLSPVAHAQTAATRSLSGVVTDKAGNKAVGAVVHLKDTRSLAQRSYITTDDGTFRFAQLSTGGDYEVWATLNDKKSPSKTISSFDSKKEVDIALKLPN